MVKKLLFLVSLLTAQLALAQDGEKPKNYVWEDIQTFEINREQPRAFFLSFSDFEKASKPISIDDIVNLYPQDTYKSLNGDWKFFFAKDPSLVKKEFFAKNFDDSKWDTIDVPNSWQCKGYDRIFYANILGEFQFDYDGNWLPGYGDCDKDNPSPVILNPTIPKIHRQVGIYRRDFTLENNWQNKEIFVRFDGVRTGFNLYINGNFVGYAEDSFTSSEFNITKYLQPGKNSIVAEVFKYSTGAFFELQDMPHMVGIIRDVMLIARPNVYIRDYHIMADISEDLKSANVKLDVDVRNLSKADAKDYFVDAYILGADGKFVSGDSIFSKKIQEIKTSGEISISGKKSVDSFKLWSPDKPNLYALLIKLSDSNGNVLETIRADFAFRKFEIRGKEIFLNNKPLLIKGVNHHDWSPDKGKAYSCDWMIKDMRLMKQANVNFVRTSHYPKDDKFYMLCSRFGILVLDECNQEQHAYRNCGPLDFDNFIPASLDRMKNMVLRDRNVPCVVIFSLGNESAGRVVKGHGLMAELSRKYSPDRFVHSEAEVGNVIDGKVVGFSDFVSPMYGGVDRMRWYLSLKNETKPFFFCEYAHAMGNAIGNFKGKWDMMRKYPSLNGGFIWDWVDQALYLKRDDDPSKLYLSDCRDWNTQPSAGNFCQNGVIMADRTHAAKYYEVQRVYQDIQMESVEGAEPNVLKLSNEFIDTNLNEFTPYVEVSFNGAKIAESKLPAIDLPSGESKQLEIELPKFDASKAGEYYYTLSFKRNSETPFAKVGDVAASAQFKIKQTEPKPDENVGHSSVSYSDRDGLVRISAGGAEYVFDKNDAALSKLSVSGTALITTPLDFDISSALIDNERGRACDHARREFGLDNLTVKKASVKLEKLASNAVRVVCKKDFLNSQGDGFGFEAVYTIFGSGFAEVSCSVQKINEMPRDLNIPRVGVRMGLSPELKSVEYFGKGPFANYCDRMYAANVGRYKSDISEWFENYTLPQDTGNREDVRWLAVRGKSGAGLLVKAEDKPLPMALLPYTQKQISEAKHPYKLPTPNEHELRVAWGVRGVGNNSCGPETRVQFRHYFEGKVSWNFLMFPIKKGVNFAPWLSKKVPEKFKFIPAKEEKNLVDESVRVKPEGKCVSENAKLTLSSKDEQYSPRNNTLLTTGEGTFAFHTKLQENPFIIIELDKACDVTGAEILNRSDMQGDRTRPLVMSLSTDSKNWERVWSSDVAKSRWTVILKNPKRAKFIKLEIPRREFLHLKKVKIYGI